jgi:3-hydroxybutyryl-CoA dehydratase
MGGIATELLEKRGWFTFDDLIEGVEFRQEYRITEDVYRRFLDLFGDASPLHVSDETAVSCGFSAKLMHGAILNGFISNFVGMNFPGKRTLELGVEISFVRPTYSGDVLTLHATVKERLESRQVVILQFRFLRDNATVAKGRISVMICNFQP